MTVQVDMGNLSRVSQYDKRQVTEGRRTGTKLHMVPLAAVQRDGGIGALAGSRRDGRKHPISNEAAVMGAVMTLALVALVASSGCVSGDSTAANATAKAAAVQEQSVTDCMNNNYPTSYNQMTWSRDFTAKIGGVCYQGGYTSGSDICVVYYACGGK